MRGIRRTATDKAAAEVARPVRNPKGQPTEITEAFRAYEAERAIIAEEYRIAVWAASTAYADAIAEHIETREAAILAARRVAEAAEEAARGVFDAARAST